MFLDLGVTASSADHLLCSPVSSDMALTLKTHPMSGSIPEVIVRWRVSSSVITTLRRVALYCPLNFRHWIS